MSLKRAQLMRAGHNSALVKENAERRGNVNEVHGTNVSPEELDAIAEVITDAPEAIGLLAIDPATGREIAINPDDRFPTASTLKVPVLYTFLRACDAGELDPEERITLRHADRVPGSGVLQDLDEGLQPTWRDVAELMITVSDNYATDLLFARLGKERIAAECAALGMTRTSIPLTIRELFCAATHRDPSDPALTYETLRDSLRSSPADPESIAYVDDPRNDVSTQRDMVRCLRAIEDGEGLTPESRERAIEILLHQKYSTILPFHLPDEVKIAHKTGSLKGIRNDVGIVYAPAGPYFIAIMSKRSPDTAATVQRLARLSKAVWDVFAGGEALSAPGGAVVADAKAPKPAGR